MSLVGFTRIAQYELPVITGTHTDYVLLLKFADFSSVALELLDDGGGDLRFSSDLAGVTQLSCDVVTFDKVGNSIQVRVKAPSASTGTVIHVWGNNTGAIQPAFAAAFGRNSVWADYEVNYHFNSAGKLIDSTGNHDLTKFGSVPNTVGQIGDAIDCAGSYSNRLEAVGYKGVTGGTARTIVAWCNNSTGLNRGLTTWGGTGTGNRFSVWFANGNFRTEVEGSFRLSSSGSDGTFRRFSSILNSNAFPSQQRHRIDGTTTVGDTVGSGVTVNTSATTDLKVAAYSNLVNVDYGSEYTDEFSIRAFDISDDLDATEYSNQSAVGAWGVMSDVATSGTEQAIVVASTEQLTQSQLVNILGIGAINAIVSEQKSQSQLVSVAEINQLSAITSEQKTQSTLIDVSDVNSISAIVCEQLTQSVLVNVTAGGAQSLNVVISEQKTQSELVSIDETASVNAITSEQLTQSNLVNIDESSGALISVLIAEQKTQSELVSISAIANINQIICEQLTESNTQQVSVDITIDAIICEQLTQSQLITIVQANIADALNIDIDQITIEMLTPKYTIEMLTPKYTIEHIH